MHRRQLQVSARNDRSSAFLSTRSRSFVHSSFDHSFIHSFSNSCLHLYWNAGRFICQMMIKQKLISDLNGQIQMLPRISITGSVRWSVGRSVRRLVRDAFVKNKENQCFRANNLRGGILDGSHVITSSYNHFLIVRTHRWPDGPC